MNLEASWVGCAPTIETVTLGFFHLAPQIDVFEVCAL